MCSNSIRRNYFCKCAIGLLICFAFTIAWPAYSSDNINLDSCPTEDVIIQLPVGVALTPSMIFIGAEGITNLEVSDILSWSYSSTPSGGVGFSCSSSGNTHNCGPISIILPDDGPETSVEINGTAIVAGEIDMGLILNNEDNGAFCEVNFILEFMRGFQLSLVLDRSGSMDSEENVTLPDTSRWKALENSITAMATPIKNEAVTIRTSDDSTILQFSEIGVSLFDTTYVTNAPHFSDALVPISDDLDLGMALGDLLDEQIPEGWTAMGQGLENAFSKLTSPTANRIVLLSTDGEQNRAPFVDENGLFLNELATTGCAVAGPDCTAIPAGIKIVTLGIMQPSSSYLLTLQNLANESGGVNIITSNSETFTTDSGTVEELIRDIEATFTASVMPLLRGNSPQLVAINRVKLIGADSTGLSAFKLNKRLGGLMLRVSLDRKFKVQELYGILSGLKIEKDGVNITTYFESKFVGDDVSSFYLVSDFEGGYEIGPGINSEGSYTISLAKPAGTPDFTVKIATFADDHLLDIDYGFTPKIPKVTEDLKLNVSLNWRGNPLDTAEVKAMILKPGDDLGDLLAKHGKRVDPSSVLDAGTPGYQKYLNLIKNDPDFLAKLLPIEQQLTLSPQGNGAYQSTYNPGDISGVYQVLYNVNADTADTGVIQRLLVQSIYVRFGDFDESASDIDTTVQKDTTRITFRPITTVGKLIGPGQQNAFSFKGKNINIENVIDYQDGRYAFIVSGDSNQDVTISVLGEPVYKGKLSQFGKNGGDLSLWLIIGLIALIILILIIWLRGKT